MILGKDLEFYSFLDVINFYKIDKAEFITITTSNCRKAYPSNGKINLRD